MKVSRKGYREAVLFIDERTYFVVKLLYVLRDVHDGGEPELFESFFSDFKKTGDLTVHSSFRSVHGGKTISHGKTLEMIVSEQALGLILLQGLSSLAEQPIPFSLSCLIRLALQERIDQTDIS